MSQILCPVCNNSTRFKKKYNLIHTVFQCSHCKLEISPDAKFNAAFSSGLNEEIREKALKNLRRENFQIIINYIRKLVPQGEGIEIGSSYGWFLEICKENGIQCVGIEPEPRFNEFYIKNGYSVRNGFYPEIILENEKYNFIIFNDVLEHIPDIETTMKSNFHILYEKGFLIINLPIQEGLFYYFSKIAYYVGIQSLLNRMWQFNFHSPHFFYFKKKNVKELGFKNGFSYIKSFPLQTIKISDIPSRIKQDKNFNYLNYFLALVGAVILYPFTKIFPDTYCFIFRKNEH